MFDLDRWEEIWSTLSRNKMRSFITSMGVFWAIVLLVVLLGAGMGMEKMLVGSITISPNSAFIITQPTSMPYNGNPKGKKWSARYDDISDLKSKVAGVQYVTRMVDSKYETVVKADKSYRTQIAGVEPENQMVDPAEIIYGRFINDLDMARYRTVCVIGKDVYEALFSEGEDPIGESIKIGSNSLIVVGVCKEIGQSSMLDYRRVVILPTSTMIKQYNLDDRINMFGFTAGAGYDISDVEKAVHERIKRLYNISPDDKKAMFTLNVKEQFDVLHNLFSGIQTLIWIVGIGTLLAGVVGVSNIMLIVLKERTQEIGVRRALGATPLNIISQIMTESFVLTFVTGVMALGFSVAILAIAENAIGDMKLQINFDIAITSAAIVIGSGLFAGIIPAIRAISINAVDAIRED